MSFWIAFHVLVLVLLFLEWLILRKQSAVRGYMATAMWLLGALGFGAAIYLKLHPQLGMEFLAGYALEESLSIDNLFVFLILFQTFHIKPDNQRRVLFWGILGAIIMRAAFIVVGVQLLERFAWITYVFAVLLLVAAVRLVLPEKEEDKHRKPGWTQWLQRYIPFIDSQDGFLVQEVTDGKTRRVPTILVLALIAIAVTDFVFAVDSIPAVLSITRHTFIAYTSNIMAVMGLRSLFFMLAHMLTKLSYLHYGLAAVLAFAAAKMLAAHWLEVTAMQSLAVIFGILAITTLISLILDKRNANDKKAHA